MTQQEQEARDEREQRKGQDIVTVNSCILQSQQKANESMAIIRQEMENVQHKQDAKLDGIASVLDMVAKTVDQMLYKMDTPQIGMTDRMAAFEKVQKETTAVLVGIQQVLSGLVEARHKTDKFIDIAIGSIITYSLVRLLPYIGQLLSK